MDDDEGAGSRELGDLVLKKGPRGVREVYFEPDGWEELMRTPAVGAPTNALIAVFEPERDRVTTYPISTLPGSRFLKPRYIGLPTISFEGFDIPAPDEVFEVEDALSDLPEGFYTKALYGLGLPKVLHPIIKAVQKVKGVRELLISKRRPTAIEGSTFVLAYSKFRETAAVMKRVANRHQVRSLLEREVFAHNLILSESFPDRWEEKRPPHTPGALHETLSIVTRTQFPLNRADRAALFTEVEKRVADLSREDPGRLVQLQRNIELVALDGLIARFQAMLADEVGSEARWQALFEHNPFILAMAFGHPVVQVRSQAWVAGARVDGSGARIVDFLLRNPATNNAGLVEIKTPMTPLLARKAYRGQGASAIQGPSKDLSGAIIQVLDQRQNLEQRIAQMTRDDRGLVLETFHVECVVLAGKTAESLEERRSLDLFRNSLKDVRVLTFNELLAKLEALRDLLASDPGAVQQLNELELEPQVFARDFDDDEDDEEF